MPANPADPAPTSERRLRVNRKRILRVIGFPIALALIGWGALHRGWTGNEAGHRAVVAPDAKALTLGSVHFAACELAQKHSGATTRAFCARFAVPENRADPARRTLELRVALIRSDAPAADRDIVVFLAGGPGQSAIDTWPQVAAAFAPLRKDHDILLVDQRGTGGSNALDCPAPGGDDGRGGAPDAAEAGRHTRDCLAAVAKHADPREYTTTAAVEDLEAVRAALGSPKLDLVGVSYGTRLAQQYMMRHPQGVRSAVLDSVVPNTLVLGEDFAGNLDAALKADFALCLKQPPCTKAFGDPWTSLIRLRDRLRATPQTWDYRDPVTFLPKQLRLDEAGFVRLVRFFAYTPESSALLPLSIAEGLRGNFTPLAGQEQLITDDLGDLSSNALQLSIACSEDADLLTARPQDAGTLLGTRLADLLRAACAVWPHGTRPADFHSPLATATPVLILEGELDPVTPPRYGEEVVKGLSNGRLLIARGQGHNVIGRGCIPRLVREFVDKLDPRALDAGCVDALGPTPAFVDFNGASP